MMNGMCLIFSLGFPRQRQPRGRRKSGKTLYYRELVISARRGVGRRKVEKPCITGTLYYELGGRYKSELDFKGWRNTLGKKCRNLEIHKTR